MKCCICQKLVKDSHNNGICVDCTRIVRHADRKAKVRKAWENKQKFKVKAY